MKILTQKDIENLWFTNEYSLDEFDEIKIILIVCLQFILY